MEIKSFDPDTQKELEDKEFQKFQSPAGGKDPLKSVEDIPTDTQDKFILPQEDKEMFPKKSVLPGVLFFVFLSLLILALLVIAVMTKQAEDANNSIDQMNSDTMNADIQQKQDVSEQLKIQPVKEDVDGNVDLDSEIKLMDNSLQGLEDVDTSGLDDSNLGL